MRDYLAIIRRNFISPITLAILLLAMALLYVREYRDAWFISVVIVINSLIGAIQEIRAKYALRKLELMSAPRARVERDGQTIEVLYDDLHLDDEIIIQAGDELPADAIVSSSQGLEVNESMLTGESAAVDKNRGDTIYAATTVVAGSGRARVVALGDDTKAGAISRVLQRYTPQLTPLQRAIQQAITVLTYGAVALAILIFARYSFAGLQAVSILKTIITAAITVVPEGLLLASSLLLAFGSLRLAQAKVLPQKLSAIEAMALLGVLCVDKTGTLTSDEVTFERAISFGNVGSPEGRGDIQPVDPDLTLALVNVANLAALVARETSGNNITGRAILAAAQPPTGVQVLDVMAFSSSRKMAMVRARIGDTKRTLILGAPEFVARQITPLSVEQQTQVDELADSGLRVLLLAESDDITSPLKQLQNASSRLLGLVVLRNSLRHGVVDTVDFLQQQGVTIRVISGDNPRTVQYIASEAGIHNPDQAITGAELAKLSDADFATAADTHTIFARVLPEQKERLITHFSQQAFTGMVGDGVNDALALKKADLGVAMYDGAPASRRVADVILLNNSFTSLPIGMSLGNRIMQAIELIGVLFFHKIIYGVVLLSVTLALGMVYPYAPRHLTFMNIFLVTMPTIMWTLFAPTPRHRINPQRFWHDTLLAVAPIAVVSGLAVSLSYWMMSQAQPGHSAMVSTMTVLVATFFGVYVVFLAGRMFGVALDKHALFGRSLYVAAVMLVVAMSFVVTPLRGFFDFTTPDLSALWPVIIVLVLVAVAQWMYATWVGRRYQHKNS